MHTFFNPDKEGWLLKQGGRYKSWKRRWFILNDNCLYYFEYTTDKEPRGIIPLENIKVRAVQDRSKPHCFELYATGDNIIKACKTDSEGKVGGAFVCSFQRIRSKLAWGLVEKDPNRRTNIEANQEPFPINIQHKTPYIINFKVSHSLYFMDWSF